MTDDPVLIWKVVSILTWVVVFLLGIVGWFLRNRVADMDHANAELEHRLDNAKTELERRVHELELKGAENNVYVQQAVQGLSSIGELRAEIAARYLTRADWAVMDQKMTKLHDRISDLFRLFATAGVQVTRGAEGG